MVKLIDSDKCFFIIKKTINSNYCKVNNLHWEWSTWITVGLTCFVKLVISKKDELTLFSEDSLIQCFFTSL